MKDRRLPVRKAGPYDETLMFWPADHKNTRIAKGEKLRLRYRVLVFSGTAESAGIARQFSEFAAGGSKP